MAVSDEVWAEFRDAAYPHSIAQALGALVEREVNRYRSERLRDGQFDDAELLDALERAQRQQADLNLTYIRE